MKEKKLYLLIWICLFLTSLGFAYQFDYLNQPHSGDIAEVFSEGGISKGYHEHGITISPNGDEFFYIMSDAYYRHYVMV